MTSRVPEALLPPEAARWTLLAATATAVGVALAWQPLSLLAVALVLAVGADRRARLVAITAVFFVVLGIASGTLAGARLEATRRAVVPDRTAALVFSLVEDASSNRYGVAVGVPRSIDGDRWNGPRLAVVGLDASIDVGAVVEATGSLRPGVRRVRDEIVAGTFTVTSVDQAMSTTNPIVVAGNAIRARVQSTFNGDRRSDGLSSGLLIGDTRFLGAHDVENLRRAGLAHFVAVSGSNVAVFMIGWWFVTAPLSIRPRFRAVLGLVGLGIFVVVTRWEPSVVRASVMMAVPLAGAMVSIPVDPWMALGVAVTVLLTVSADLLWSVGFQLSVAATVGVLVGVRVAKGRKPRWLWTSILVTVFAQLAVAPIILRVFGSVPLWAPVANLVVAPIVTAATVAGGVSLVVGAVEPLAALLSSVVLLIAQWASQGPQLGTAGVVLAVGVGGMVAHRSTRTLGIVVAVIVAVGGSGGASSWPVVPSVTVLDVGQGDAILLQDPSGAAMLVDGGPDPGVIDRALRDNGVSRIDIIVVTHSDVDHVGGLAEVVQAFDVGAVWVSSYMGRSDLFDAVRDVASRRQIPIVEVEAGMGTSIGGIRVDVVSPARRFASDNDGSIAIVATAARSVLIPGDIEAIAQRELPELRPDIMIVPHHGSSSTDDRWLSRVVGDVAIVSYGDNTYGHPNPLIMAILEGSGTEIRETYVEGDVTVSLSSDG